MKDYNTEKSEAYIELHLPEIWKHLGNNYEERLLNSLAAYGPTPTYQFLNNEFTYGGQYDV